MAPGKRKRTSDGSTASDDASTGANTPQLLDEVIPFKIELLKAKSAKRLKKEQGQWTAPREEPSPLENGAPIYYRVAPKEEWDLKKYKQFVVQESTFSIGDHVFINNGTAATAEDGPDERDLWIGKILECRAASPSHVWIRIMYLYWPHELPEHLQRPYYGQHELIASNHMEVVDAQCVEDLAAVVQVSDTDVNPTPPTSLYWRQYFDFLENKVSPALRRDCQCNKPTNPDYLLIHCPNEGCGKWLHEECLAKEACRKQWQRLTSDGGTAIPKQEEDSTIKVDTQGTPASAAKRAKGRPAKKGRKKSKGAAAEKDEEPWNGVLEGLVERSPADDLESKNISGECIIKMRQGDDVTEVREPLFCLLCNTALGAKDRPLTPPRDS